MPDDPNAVSDGPSAEELASFADEFKASGPVEPTSDDLPPTGDEPVVEDLKPQADDPAPEPKTQVEDKPPAPEPTEKMYTLPDTEVYGDLRGKKVTLKQLEESGLLDKMVTRDHQEMHNTKLYQDLKSKFDEQIQEAIAARLKEAGIQPKAPDETQQVDQKAFGDAVEQHYVPQLRQVAEEGAFETDFVDAYPRVASQLEHRFRSGAVALTALAERLAKVESWTGEKQAVEVQETGNADLHQRITAAAESNEMLARLKDDSHRQSFIDWAVADDNPLPYKDVKLSAIGPELVMAAYLAYMHANPDAVKPAAAPVTRKPNMATAGAGTNPSRGKTEANELEQMAAEYKASLQARR